MGDVQYGLVSKPFLNRPKKGVSWLLEYGAVVICTPKISKVYQLNLCTFFLHVSSFV
jgi:hypothetical protein